MELHLKDALDNYQVYTKEQIETLPAMSLPDMHTSLDSSSAIFRNDLEEEQQGIGRVLIKS